MHRSCTIFLAVILSFCVMFARGINAADGTTVSDMGKRTIDVPANVQRIVCLSPGTLRLIVYLGASDRVVGVEDFEKTSAAGRPYILAHPELTRFPIIGPGGPGSINKEPDLEAVLKTHPDIIFVTYMEPARADALQKKLGIPVVILSYGKFASFDESIYESLRLAGKILRADRRAEEVIGCIEVARKDLHMRTQDIPDATKPSVYVGAVGYRGVQGIESTDASYMPFEWVGAKNCAKAIATKDHLFIDKEKLLALNPDIIFVDSGFHLVKQDFDKKPEFYKGLKAFRDKRVHVIYPFNYYVTNIGTAIVDAYAVGKILYPNRFSDLDLKTKSDEIYTFLYGTPLYQRMEQDFGPLGHLADFNK